MPEAIGSALEPAAPRGSEPEVHEDYLSAYDLRAIRRVRGCDESAGYRVSRNVFGTSLSHTGV